MSRKKNALTEYHVGAVPESPGETTYHELAKWISNVTDDSNEETEDQGFYDGDGTPETDVISVKKTYTFEGMYDDADPAMKFIANLEFATGEDRKVMFKQVRTDGSTLEGPATLTGIKVTGGDATEYAAFECAVSWDKKPTITP
ncbi:phage tail protein [Sporosarcina sp. P13]|uniref:phage tail tube protein n=1 Tax=Sporosarcina sp. P13 TaxID=2048263 RepID=UPI000C1724D2|nr:phage tail protein [Sporosarcina sp. P13]PIC65336.1 phage tail protein [Sporosarcina sp. P13]